MKMLALRCAGALWWLFGKLIRKRPNLVVLNTFPDFDDTTRAVVNCLPDLGYELVILSTDRAPKMPEWLRASRVEVAYRYSARGMLLYHRAKIVLYTHGCFSAWPLSKNQIVVNLWHGMPIKRIGLLAGKSPEELPRFHYVIAHDDFFSGVMAEAFGVPVDRVIRALHPRIDVLCSSWGGIDLGLPEGRWLAVWLPTYRRSFIGDIRVDGSPEGDIFADPDGVAKLDQAFHERGVICVVKPHPMARASRHLFENAKSLIFLDDHDLAARNVSLYQLLSWSDFMITDVSSVYVDYSLLGRPIIPFFQDVQEYESSRGFVAPIDQLVREPIVRTRRELLERVDAILKTSTPMPRVVDVSLSRERTASLMRVIAEKTGASTSCDRV